jgi:hypothetical protein
MKVLLVIEDGNEYEEFVRLFLSDTWSVRASHSLAEARAVLAKESVDAMLVDLRFTRSEESDLTGDVASLAASLFAGDREKAAKYVREQQGVLVLAALREGGHAQRAVFVTDFAKRRLANLRSLYGDVAAVPSFDAAAVRAALSGGA